MLTLAGGPRAGIADQEMSYEYRKLVSPEIENRKP